MFDQKESGLVKGLHQRLIEHAFGEYEVLALLILLREHVPRDSPLREFADFVAHRRRDRGAFARHLNELRRKEPDLSATSTHDQIPHSEFFTAVFSQNPVYKEDSILEAFNHAFAQLGLQVLPFALRSDLIFCLISLLQDIRFLDEKQTEVGHTLAAFNETHVVLLSQFQSSAGKAIAVPLLSTVNRYSEFRRREPREVGFIPNTVFRVVRQDGRLRADSK